MHAYRIAFNAALGGGGLFGSASAGHIRRRRNRDGSSCRERRGGHRRDVEPGSGGVPSGTTIGVGVVVSVPDAAKVGDTFSLTLDSHVVGMSNSFDMKDPHGAIIAQCVVAARAVTCTYTNYVETHSDITATLSFTVVGKDVTNGSGLKWIDEAVKSSEREPRSLRSTEAFPTNSISCTRSTRMGPLRIG